MKGVGSALSHCVLAIANNDDKLRVLGHTHQVMEAFKPFYKIPVGVERVGHRFIIKFCM